MPAALLMTIFLFVIVLLIYGGTLSSNFLADDFWQINNAARNAVEIAQAIKDGRVTAIFAIVSNYFTAPYSELPGVFFYRPVLGLSFLFDFVAWNVNPLGYHLTNIVLYGVTASFIFSLTREVAGRCFGLNRMSLFRFDAASLAAGFSAILFAVNPLHAEPVAWISGRSELLSGCFYVSSLYLWMRSLSGEEQRRVIQMASSLALYSLALLVKETTIGLPLVVFALSVITKNAGTIRDTMRSALKTTFPYFVVACLYLLLRFLLHAESGSTSGIMQMCSIALHRILDYESWLMVFFPFNAYYLQRANWISILLAVLYTILILTKVPLVFKTGSPVQSSSQPVFGPHYILSICGLSFVWIVSTLIPVSPFWTVNPLLQNSRLVYLFTVPLSIVLGLLPFLNRGDQQKVSWNERLGTVALIGIAFIFLSSSMQLNELWKRAGSTTATIAEQAKSLSRNLADQKQIALLGIPNDHKGAFVLLDSFSCRYLLSPPFADVGVLDKTLIFKSFLGGPDLFVDSSRLKRLVQQECDVYIWDDDAMSFRKIPVNRDLGQSVLDVSLERKESSNVVFWESADLNISPFSFDYLEFEISGKQKSQPILARVAWNDDRSLASEWIRFEGVEPQVVRIELSNFLRWYSDGRIRSLHIDLQDVGSSEELGLKNCRLIPREKICPTLQMKSSRELTSGEHVLQEIPTIVWDATNVLGAKSIVLEETRANDFFYNMDLSGSRELSFANTLRFDQLKGESSVNFDWFQPGSYHQIRMSAFDEFDKPIGESSGTITVFRPSENGTFLF